MTSILVPMGAWSLAGLRINASKPGGRAATYPVVLTVTDNGGVTDTDAQDVPVGSPSLHMGVLDGNASPSTGPAGKRDAAVAIEVHDNSHAPISGATVSGSWSAGTSGSGSCVTDSPGQCEITRNNINKNSTSVTFAVGNLTHTTHYFNSGANHDEPNGDSSDGTTITILRP